MIVVGTDSRKASLSPMLSSYSDFFFIPLAGFWYNDLMTLTAAKGEKKNIKEATFFLVSLLTILRVYIEQNSNPWNPPSSIQSGTSNHPHDVIQQKEEQQRTCCLGVRSPTNISIILLICTVFVSTMNFALLKGLPITGPCLVIYAVLRAIRV